MKRILSITLLAATAIWMSACGAPATNAPANTANTNMNTAKPTTAAPTADAFLDMEKKANEAYGKGDGAYFEGMLNDKATMSMGKEHMNKAAIVAMIKTAKCEGLEVKLSEPQISKIDNDTYAFTYKNASTGKCTDDKGKMQETMPMRASTVWVRNGEKWQAAWHGETLIMAPPVGDKKTEAKADDKKADSKADEPKKDDKMAAEPKKDEAKPAANAAADAKPDAPKPSANTDALMKAHGAGWEAFRNKDAKAFEGMLASTFANIQPNGSYVASKADAIKMWTESMKCEGITKTSFTDGFSTSVSPTVEILYGKGTADGTCDGQKNGPLYQTAVYVKEGDAWKLAFMFESLPM